MTKLFSLVFVSALAMNAQAAEQDAKYFQITKVKMTDVTEQFAGDKTQFAQAGLYENCNQSQVQSGDYDFNTSGVLNPIDQAGVIIDKIVNLGRKIWVLVETGRPVVNVAAYTANALPAGIQCWSDLSGWQIPQSKVYRVTYENAYGIDVVDFAYRVGFTAGGSLNGQGKYITNAFISPAEVKVAWGYNLAANAEVPSVFNTGSKEQPVAGMQMLMKWKVNTVMNHLERTDTFYVGGNNVMKHLE